jgi:2-polyprenyl-3-methyl-5-hydroxy-6-metoxy-1,4-benzoquinol methylase
MNSRQSHIVTIPATLSIPQGQTEKYVNRTVLEILNNSIDRNEPVSMLDLPCGNMELLICCRQLFPAASLAGADLYTPVQQDEMRFIQMDLTGNFTELRDEQFDVVLSVSGIMMFGNTQRFIDNCSRHIRPGGTLIITNDNHATIRDRLYMLLFGRFRMFRLLYEDDERTTQYVSMQELVWLLRKYRFEIANITYTSFYWWDVILLPLLVLIYPFHWLYLQTRKTGLPKSLRRKMFPLTHFFKYHYVIIAKRI